MRLEDFRVEIPRSIVDAVNDETLTRPATLADILALLREMGGEEREAFHPSDNFGWQRPILAVSVDKPGRYLTVSLDVLAADTGKEQ